MEQQKYLRPIEEREIISGDSLRPPPAALVGVLAQQVSGHTGQSISVAQLQQLVAGGLDPLRSFVERPEYVTHQSAKKTNLLAAMLSRGNSPCLRWIMENCDLSQVVFTGDLGKGISERLVQYNSGPMVAALVEAGLRAAGVLTTVQSGKSPFDKTWVAASDYDTAISNSASVAFVDAMRRTGQMEHPGNVFRQLLVSQSSATMPMVRHFSRACGGVMATDFSAEESRRVIARLLMAMQGKEKEEALAQLIEWGFDRYPVAELDRHGTALPAVYEQAAQLGLPLLEFLHSAQFDLEEKDGKGKTILMSAVERSDLPAVRWLVEHGARVDVQSEDGSSLMHIATLRGTLPLIDYLFAVGAPVSLRDKMGRTPLAVDSAASDYLHLLTRGSIPHGRTLAMLAFSDGCDEKLEEAIGAGDDVNALDDDGKGIVDRMMTSPKARANPRVWELIGKAGFNFEVLVTPRGGSQKNPPPVPLLHLYCSQQQSNAASAGLIRWMVAAGADVDVKDSEGQTPLHVAVKSLNRPAVEALLEMGADPTIKLGNRTILQLTKDEEIKRILAVYRTGRVVTNAMGGMEEPFREPASGASSDPSPI